MSALRMIALGLAALYALIVLVFWLVWAFTLTSCGPGTWPPMPELPPVDRPVVQPGH